VPSRWGAELRCEVCGARYREMHTGLSFADVRRDMHSGSADPKDWRQKRRRGVLGYWHEIKLSLWRSHLAWCESSALRSGHGEQGSSSSSS
jgi:hypothetical protein